MRFPVRFGVGVIALALLMSVLPMPGQAQSAGSADEVYLFGFFRGGSQDGLHLAWSNDGLKWEAIAGDQSFLRPVVGQEKLMRDPSLFRADDGTFHMVWTCGWSEKQIGYANSKDLIHWSEQKTIPVMVDEAECQQCWAPEIRFNREKSEYIVYWSSTVGPWAARGRGPEQAPATRPAGYFKTYSTTTKDFVTFTPTRVFFDAGFGQIDASILEDNGKYVLFFKHGGQGTQLAFSDKLDGPYTNISDFQFAWPNADQWEGAWPMKIGDSYIAYVDHYRNRDRMGAWRSKDLKTWENITEQTSGLFDIRHGSVIKVPRSMIATLNAAAPATQPRQ